VQPFRMAQQNERLRGAKLGDFTYTRYPLHLGGLSGNMFDIILRNVRGSPADINLAADALKKSGFINYFGLQRFGNAMAPTHEYPKIPLPPFFHCLP
jgi:tRNA pseudouridine13 synthase